MKGAQESAVHLKSVAVISRTLPFFVVACLSLALSDIDFVALERPTPNKSKSPLCVKRRILKLYKYYTPTCRLQISSFVIIGFSAVSVDHCLSVEHPPKDGHTNPTRHYIFQQLPGNDS